MRPSAALRRGFVFCLAARGARDGFFNVEPLPRHCRKSVLLLQHASINICSRSTLRVYLIAPREASSTLRNSRETKTRSKYRDERPRFRRVRGDEGTFRVRCTRGGGILQRGKLWGSR